MICDSRFHRGRYAKLVAQTSRFFEVCGFSRGARRAAESQRLRLRATSLGFRRFLGRRDQAQAARGVASRADCSRQGFLFGALLGLQFLRQLQLAAGVFRPLQLLVGSSEQAVRCGARRIQADGLLELRRGFLIPAELVQGLRQIQLSFSRTHTID